MGARYPCVCHIPCPVPVITWPTAAQGHVGLHSKPHVSASLYSAGAVRWKKKFPNALIQEMPLMRGFVAENDVWI